MTRLDAPPGAPALRVLGRVDIPARAARPRPAPSARPGPPARADVLVALDGAAAREGVRRFLDGAGLSVAVVPADGAAVLAAVREGPPAVLLLSADTRGPDAFEVLARLAAEAPSVRTLVLTAGERPALVLRALNAGAAGHLDAGAELEAYRRAVRAAARGQRVLSDAVRDALVEAVRTGRGAAGLTAREFQVVRLVARGLTTAEIAADMGVSASTVRTHKAEVRAKLGVAGDAAIARYAFDHDVA